MNETIFQKTICFYIGVPPEATSIKHKFVAGPLHPFQSLVFVPLCFDEYTDIMWNDFFYAFVYRSLKVYRGPPAKLPHPLAAGTGKSTSTCEPRPDRSPRGLDTICYRIWRCDVFKLDISRLSGLDDDIERTISVREVTFRLI